MSDGPVPPVASEEDSSRRRRQATVVLGLLLTLVAVLLAAGALPVAPGALTHDLLLIGGAVFLAWLGGILMGRSSGRRAARRGP